MDLFSLQETKLLIWNVLFKSFFESDGNDVRGDFVDGIIEGDGEKEIKGEGIVKFLDEGQKGRVERVEHLTRSLIVFNN